MQQFKNKKWFFPFAVVLCLCAIALGVQVTYGAYIRRSYVKAVIATNETEKLFGSNLLYGVKNQPEDPDKDDWLSVYPYSISAEDQGSITVPIKIYNYLAEDQDRVNQLDVNYQISFQISGTPTMTGGNLTGYSVNGYPISEKDKAYYLGTDCLTVNKGDAATLTLPGRLPNMNEYDITIPSSDLGKVSIVVKAARVPDKETGNYGTDLLYLAARVVPSLPSTVQTATVTGEFTEKDKGIPEDFAAYNYSIKLDGAPCVVVLKWNTGILEIDPFFEEKYRAKPENGQVIFNMEPGITMIQFYRKGNVEGKVWDDLGVTVSER